MPNEDPLYFALFFIRNLTIFVIFPTYFAAPSWPRCVTDDRYLSAWLVWHEYLSEPMLGGEMHQNIL